MADKASEASLAALLESPNFSVASYLNTALAENDDEVHMAELALQLQLQTQSCHEAIGRMGAELQAILPRCSADVGRLSVGLGGMTMDAKALLQECSSTSSEGTRTSMETLSVLHALRSNLTTTKEILSAAASWDSTLSSLPQLLAQQQLVQAVASLKTLQDGERALRGMPGREDREVSIEKIQSQVEVLLKPQLLHALQNMNSRLSPLQQCVSMYSSLGQVEKVQKEYITHRPGFLHKTWFAFRGTARVEQETMKGLDENGFYNPNASNNEPVLADHESSFVVWLPGWYDSVLNLLSEERRVCSTVFGKEQAPEMIAKVLGECFRPILPSFISRLTTLYSPDGSTEDGSFESICTAYEATLQFLSMAYEQMTGLVESSAHDKRLEKMIRSIFGKIASPFAPYQLNLPKLEAANSSVGTRMVAKDLQTAVQSSNSLSKLQDAMERLKGLAPFVFTIVESALARLELLTCGYRMSDSLNTMDQLLSSHIGELSMAIGTLSAGTRSDQMDSFDEQHVQCALEVLRIAGSLCRDLRSLENRTRDRLQILSRRIAASMMQEKQIGEGGYVMPDSFSPVEIDTFLCKSVLCDDNEQTANAALSVLHTLEKQEGVPAVPLFEKSVEGTTKLAQSCHRFVFDTFSAVPIRSLESFSSNAAWKREDSRGSIESFGISPQSYITQVGEHMLALVPALEPFSEGGALDVANEIMGGVRTVALQPWRNFANAMDYDAAASEEVVKTLMEGKELSSYLVNQSVHEEEDDEEEEEEESPSEVFCNQWLDVVGLAVTGMLLEKILWIPRLSEKGARQLSTDLNYLVNVLSALGISGHPHPMLSHLSGIVLMDRQEVQERLSNRQKQNSVLSSLHAVEARIALIRGIQAMY